MYQHISNALDILWKCLQDTLTSGNYLGFAEKMSCENFVEEWLQLTSLQRNQDKVQKNLGKQVTEQITRWNEALQLYLEKSDISV